MTVLLQYLREREGWRVRGLGCVRMKQVETSAVVNVAGVRRDEKDRWEIGKISVHQKN